MTKYDESEKGFTLIESLLVLSIVSILLSLSFIKFSPVMEKKVIPQFFEQLTNDVLYAQQYAMSSKSSVNLVFSSSTKQYYIQVPTENRILLRREFNHHIDINTRVASSIVRFNAVGNIMNPGTYGISYKSEEQFLLVFQLGYGKFYVEEV
ncbi:MULTISPECIES: competence type IV pilus minor pilin ComGD [Bacillus]|uniref:competence type IV pilus minor pilin ComGD n=1 Tax=Bacillus TaxID=1386 RepID=UPI001596A767|nr:MULTISPECIES: competence type IV pilus minor pilin ComGD [Bacillus]